MSSDAPIEASNTAPVKEFIKDGKTGALFDFFDTNELIQTVIKQLDAKQSHLGKLTRAARELVENNFGQATCVEQLLRLIESVVDTKLCIVKITAKYWYFELNFKHRHCVLHN